MVVHAISVELNCTRVLPTVCPRGRGEDEIPFLMRWCLLYHLDCDGRREDSDG